MMDQSCASFVLHALTQLALRRRFAQQKRYAELRAQYKRMIIYACLLLFSVVAALHLALLYRPDLLRLKLRESTVEWLWNNSPIFKRLGVRAPRCAGVARLHTLTRAAPAYPQLSYMPAGAARAAAGAASGRFDEL